MCGIAGFVRTARDADAAALDAQATAMADALSHRGPDDAGTWIDAEAGIALGHRRLSIIDLSPTGHQPMVSADGRWVLTYNGELYNTPDLRAVLLAGGVELRGSSDTEVLLETISRHGVVEALRRVDGMFALAVWDRSRRVLTLARDRMGEKPLYWGWQGGALLFGSELKALRRHPAFVGRIDRDAAGSMLRYGYVPAPWSIYEGISKVLPGTVLEIDPTRRGVQTAVPYWSLREVAEGARDADLTDTEVVDRLEGLLSDAVRSRMAADVPLGAFLSGGIDSSTVVALMQAQSARPVRTFTIGFAERGYDEAVQARAVAAHLGTEHTELYVTPADALAIVPDLAHMYDEPFADPSQIPTHLVSTLARRSVTVALSGDAGDELFGGYTRYTFHRGVWGRLSRVPTPVRGLAARGIRQLSPARWDALGRRLDPLLPAVVPRSRLGDKLHKGASMLGAQSPEQVYRPLLSHWHEPADVVLGGTEHHDAAVDASRWSRLADATERLMYLDSIAYLPDDILVKLDRASMATSLETRVPLLDPKVIAFAWSLPLDQKIRGAQGKWPLRQVLHRYVPQALVDRPKMGFGVPVGEWIRGPLRPWVEDLVDERSLRNGGLLDAAVVRARWSEHLSGRRDWSYAMWDVLMLVAWHRSVQSAPETVGA